MIKSKTMTKQSGAGRGGVWGAGRGVGGEEETSLPPSAFPGESSRAASSGLRKETGENPQPGTCTCEAFGKK